MATYPGACFCGAVTLECSGEPLAMGYCHCRSCRSWSAGPVSAWTIWLEHQVTVTGGQAHLGTFARTDGVDRQFCKLCGGIVMTGLTGAGLVDVYAATIPDLPFAPSIHIHYPETVLPMKDGLPKFRDLPEEAGGSGETVPE